MRRKLELLLWALLIWAPRLFASQMSSVGEKQQVKSREVWGKKDGQTGESWAENIEPFTHRRSFIEYNESSQTVVNKKLILEQRRLVAKMKEMQPNLAFPKRAVVDGLKALVKKKNWSFKTKESEKHYYQTMQQRFRNLGRAVAQTEAKHPNCKWLKHMPWNKKTDPVDGSDDHDDDDDNDDNEEGAESEE